MKKLIFGLFLIILSSCNEKEQIEFSLEGKTKGIENGTLLYLDADNGILDSTKIKENTFTFHTDLTESPKQVILRTKDFSHYRYLWLEDSTMTFDATKSDFRLAKVTGSYEENLSQKLSKKTDSLPRDEQLKMDMEFVENHPNSIHSSYLLSVYSSTWGKKKTVELYENFSSKNKNNQYGKKISKYIELNQNPKLGEQFVDFEMQDTVGKIKKLSSLKGKAILLEFWAAWCGPCRKENPNLVKTYNKFHPKGFEIFAVSLDSNKENWLKAIKDDSLIWNHVNDLKGDENKASLIYGINGIPDNFLISESGEIIGRNLRGEKLNQKLTEILQ
ncbi:TlpA disulfide reductase family protein [Christiangramia sabulilitoris]|uniref:AhpC/TSA family protein n=1 Tax=Christiangramia sabulilitoris TaxID=2583991 RepID=A0A550I734_9FLAO|nr:TlpA disulfide reductase family protein [Christiangramia sabulilitoris]TRO66783.1 AhpC/TSA family protein [Christiangramia sabulilitoris]